ncbi:unnamed protein product [Durusdinium trenchii]|uniref:Ubiquitin-like domain-containing protein n=1 Tax=Durusdinium trenchii TaxID=1381693 RepID=A0ABP0JBG5_9DINO
MEHSGELLGPPVPSIKKAAATRHSAGLLPPTRPPQKIPPPPQGMLRITVVTPRKGEYKLEISDESTREDVKQHLKEAKSLNELYNDPMIPKTRDDVEVRILYKGIPMTSQCLKALGVTNGSKLLAVPCLREPRMRMHSANNTAPRGLLMTSTRAWKPSQAREPRQVLFITPEVGSYSANLVHPILNPHPPLPMPT